jgi:hypothetical protein
MPQRPKDEVKMSDRVPVVGEKVGFGDSSHDYAWSRLWVRNQALLMLLVH